MKALYADASIGTIGLLFFFTVFVGVAIWAYLPRNRAAIEAHKNIPLEDEE